MTRDSREDHVLTAMTATIEHSQQKLS